MRFARDQGKGGSDLITSARMYVVVVPASVRPLWPAYARTTAYLATRSTRVKVVPNPAERQRQDPRRRVPVCRCVDRGQCLESHVAVVADAQSQDSNRS